MKISKLSLGVLALLLVSCVREAPLAEDVTAPESFETKVVKLADEYSPSTFLVKFTAVPTTQQVEALGFPAKPLFISTRGNEELEHQFGLDRWYVVDLPEGTSLEKASRQAAALSEVAVVEYNHIASAPSEMAVPCPTDGALTKGTASTFNDGDLFTKQWHYDNQGNRSVSTAVYKGADVNVKDVWKLLTCGDPDIVVAVVDQGVKHSHPDLKDNMWVNTKEVPGNGIDDDGNGYIDDVYGYNFCDDGPITWDIVNSDQARDNGHGTHCAGTIAAVNNNGKGVVGIAGGSGNKDGCRIMSCQIFSGGYGGGTTETVNAIKYAADMGASVISCSFGYKSAVPSDNAFLNLVGTAEVDVIRYFEAHKGNNPVLDGNIAIFAAGNEKQGFAHYPGAMVDIISVSAFGPDFLPAYYTNYGPGCNIAAPGGNYNVGGNAACVLSTLPSELYKGEHYGYMQGTSMACPHVSGVVALALSYAKQRGKMFTVQQFKQLIMASTKDIDKRIANADASYAKYYHNVGTGAIDAWSLMMHIDGIPSSTATIGKSQWIDLTDLFGSASVSLTYLSVDVPQATIDALGLQKMDAKASGNYVPVPEGECYAYVQFGRLYIHPTKIGSGKISISMIGGGDHLGGGDNPPGGMKVTEELSIIAREGEGGNGTGGWL